MLARFEYALSSEKEIKYQMSSLFHGALMELIPENYAALLHESRMHPYAQHLERKDGQWFWTISTLNDDMAEVIKNAIEGVERIALRSHDMDISLSLASSSAMTKEELNQIFYNAPAEKYIQIRFLTPTSFKRSGEYLIYPDIFCIYQSLMNKMDAVQEQGFLDEETLNELVTQTRIVRYKLSSTMFSLEGVQIPSFLGTVTIKLGGTETMRRFTRMLLAFGEYSGVGIKTSIGMGAIQIGQEAVMRKAGQAERGKDGRKTS